MGFNISELFFYQILLIFDSIMMIFRYCLVSIVSSCSMYLKEDDVICKARMLVLGLTFSRKKCAKYNKELRKISLTYCND